MPNSSNFENLFHTLRIEGNKATPPTSSKPNTKRPWMACVSHGPWPSGSTNMRAIYNRHSWTPVQRKWLEHLAKQLTHEVIIDSAFVNRAFSTDGGAKRLNKILGNHLDEVLEELADGVWESAG